jgi:hypothetical protein
MHRSSRNISKYDFFISEDELELRLQEVEELEWAALEESTRQAIDSHKRCYSIFCRSARVQSFPVTYRSLALFLVQYCKWFGHTARSIPTILSHIKRSNRQYSSEWLKQESLLRLADLITALKKKDANKSKQKLPITHDVMDAIERAADMTQYPDFQHVVMSRVARDALLRGAEVIAMRIGEITWNHDCTQATIAIHGSKAHKVVHEPERITICDYGPSSGVAYLREYFSTMRLDDKAPALPLWPLTEKNGEIKWSVPLAKQEFIKRARILLAKAGYPSLRYAGHSYRSGGTTDLWDSNRCRPLTIKLHGRWKSDAYRLYIRDNPAKTAEEVANAMAFFDRSTM